MIPETLGEYIGLEIYENDIVFIPEHYVGRIVYEYGEFVVLKVIDNTYICDLFDLVNNYQGKVIGNTIDNPELIKACCRKLPSW